MRAPDNWHAHFRQGLLLVFLVGILIKYGWRRRVAAEPNTTPAILTGEQAIANREEIIAQSRTHKHGKRFEPVPIMQITESTTGDMVREARLRYGVRIFKVYPFFVTTNSANGVKDYTKIYTALKAVEEFYDVVVQFHGEDPNDDVEGIDKQVEFLKILKEVRRLFPRLHITVEHVGSAEVIEWVEAEDEHVAASLTIQHILNTMDELMGYSRRSGGKMMPHEGCKPQPLRRKDRDAVQRAALSGNPKFFYGGDDAAHLKSNKECAHPACGCWNTIPALSLLIEFFMKHDKLELLEAFLSEYGARYYRYPLNEETITLTLDPWVVPNEVIVPALGDSVVPFYAGETCQWQISA